jgi:eukaryotic-like serine/threonine-protein kinase
LNVGAVSVGPGAELIDGRYRLERLIGIGGMASVWKGRDQRLDRSVAVKVLSDALAADPDFVARFRREAQVAARLSHPNLVKVFDYDPEGRPCLVMEYVPGGTLADTANRPGNAVDVEALALQLLSALDHIHGAGIVHRDVKPANVLIGRDGRALLTDFGVAQPEDATRLTQTGQVIGTLAYMAPEVQEGARATPRSDLYSCGVLLRDHLDSGSSPGLERLVDRLTERDPELRPRSARRALAYLAGAGPASVAAGQHAAVTTREMSPPRAPAAPRSRPPAEREVPIRPRAEREIPIRPSHVLAVALVALAAIVAVIAIATIGGGDEPEPAVSGQAGPSSAGNGQGSDGGETAAEAAASPDDVIPPPKPNAEAAEGASMEQEAFSTLQTGDAAGAIKQYEKALAQFPADARSPAAFEQYPNYAYALYSYADALIQEGRPEEAIPVLQERLKFADQQETVQALLDEAETAAGE